MNPVLNEPILKLFYPTPQNPKDTVYSLYIIVSTFI